jgi:hypothetical protein
MPAREIRLMVLLGLFIALGGIWQLAFADHSLEQFIGGAALLAGTLMALPWLIVAAIHRQSP